MEIQRKSQNRQPEKVVLVIDVLFLIFGAIVNAVGGLVRAARTKSVMMS